MKNQVSNFKNFLIEEKKSSKNTLDSYMRDVNQFYSYCISQKCKSFSGISVDFLNKYVEYLKFNGKSQSTVTRTVASLRCFFRYLVSVNVMRENPISKIKSQKYEKKLPEVLEEGEILLLLSKPDMSDFKGVRDKAMLELLYATGIKVSELIELSLSDINLQLGILHLHKGNKERIIPIYPAAIKTLTNYCLNVRPVIVLSEDEDKLFTNMNGCKMSRQGFWKIIKFYAEKAGINKEITPNTLRHSFATHLLENGANLKDIKEMLGHSDISSTQIYAQFIKTKYATAYSKFHPLAK